MPVVGVNADLGSQPELVNSDPFGKGWNLFGTAGYRVDIAIIGARFAWYAAVAAIVTGHVTAVYLAHTKAMRVMGGRGAALRSQVPLTALMVVYTFVGLSITAEPIVGGRVCPRRPRPSADRRREQRRACAWSDLRPLGAVSPVPYLHTTTDAGALARRSIGAALGDRQVRTTPSA